MTAIAIQPAAFQTTGSAPGWNTGTLGPAALASLPGGAIPTVTGLKQTAQDLFADAPPIGKAIYLVTGFVIPYSAQLQDSVSETSFTSRVKLRLFRNGANVYSAEDDQNCHNIAASGNPTWASAGVFYSNLVNPIAIRATERLSLQLSYFNPWILEGCTVAIGAQIAPSGGTYAAATQAQPATIDMYETVQP